jgi:hypothetical protein
LSIDCIFVKCKSPLRTGEGRRISSPTAGVLIPPPGAVGWVSEGIPVGVSPGSGVCVPPSGDGLRTTTCAQEERRNRNTKIEMRYLSISSTYFKIFPTVLI